MVSRLLFKLKYISFGITREFIRNRINSIYYLEEHLATKNYFGLLFIAVPLGLSVLMVLGVILLHICLEILLLLIWIIVNFPILHLLGLSYDKLTNTFTSLRWGFNLSYNIFRNYIPIILGLFVGLPVEIGNKFHLAFKQLLEKYNIYRPWVYIRTFSTLVLYIWLQYISLSYFPNIHILFYYIINIILIAFIIRPALPIIYQDMILDIIFEFWLPYFTFYMLVIIPNWSNMYYPHLEHDSLHKASLDYLIIIMDFIPYRKRRFTRDVAIV